MPASTSASPWRRPAGLVTPIVRDADAKSLRAIVAPRSRRSPSARGRARSSRTSIQGGELHDLQPRACTASASSPRSSTRRRPASWPSARREQRAVVRDGALAIATLMTCTLSADHRVVDGVAGRRVPGGVAAPRSKQPLALLRVRPDMTSTLRPDRDRRRPRRLRRRDPRRAARHEGRAGRARAPGRHLPQLGLHPDQGAAALRRGAGPDARRGGVRPRASRASRFDLDAIVARSRAVAARLQSGVTRPAAQERGRGRGGPGLAWRGPRTRRGDGPRRRAQRARGPARHPRDRARGRACCPGSSPTACGSGTTGMR